jgi:hypothetical protein
MVVTTQWFLLGSWPESGGAGMGFSAVGMAGLGSLGPEPGAETLGFSGLDLAGFGRVGTGEGDETLVSVMDLAVPGD